MRCVQLIRLPALLYGEGEMMDLKNRNFLTVHETAELLQVFQPHYLPVEKTGAAENLQNRSNPADRPG